MPGRWKKLVDMAVLDAPKVGACYAIYLDGRLHYVGSTENLKVRMFRHVKLDRYSDSFVTPWGEAWRVTVKYRPSRRYGDWAMVELRMIRRLRPAGNIRGVAGAAAGRKRATG